MEDIVNIHFHILEVCLTNRQTKDMFLPTQLSHTTHILSLVLASGMHNFNFVVSHVVAPSLSKVVFDINMALN
jgi:hypothetical protein